MLFAIIGHDGADGPRLRPQVRQAHLDNLRPLAQLGKVVLAGPFTDGSGSLIVVDMDSQADALAFAQSDPYVTQGVFESIEVRPFRKVFPE
jgi:uncharacterized protein